MWVHLYHRGLYHAVAKDVTVQLIVPNLDRGIAVWALKDVRPIGSYVLDVFLLLHFLLRLFSLDSK